MNQVSALYASGHARGSRTGLEDLNRDLRAASQRLLAWPIDRITNLFAQFSDWLLSPESDLHLRYPRHGVPYIARWSREEGVRALLDQALGDRTSLDRFVADPARVDRRFRAFPRGLVVHWLAGNVPTLGFLSLAQGLLTKNANLVKLATGSDEFLGDLLEAFAALDPGAAHSGAALLESVAVVHYDRTSEDLGPALSLLADVRITWGSDAAIQAIRALPVQPGVEDVVFPNRTSLAMIDSGALAGDIEDICRRVARDVSIFEQKACASPHTVFLETDDDDLLEQFGASLCKALERALVRLPPSGLTPQETSTILAIRTEYQMFHRAWTSAGAEFAVLHDDLFQLGPAIGNRNVYLRKVDDLKRVAKLITPQVQTVGIEATPESLESLTTLLGACGVHRFTRLGTMTQFDMPWDGCLLPQRLVRWTSRPEKPLGRPMPKH